MAVASRPLVDRFWACVNKTAACWLWTGPVQKNGYGQMSRSGRRGAAWVHRVSYELAHGPIPAGLCVCHKCDTPLCVRPDHLFLGTRADNLKDAMIKRRVAWGSRNSHAKLTADQVTEIHNQITRGVPKATVQRDYGISRSHLNAVLRGVFWRNLDMMPRHSVKPFIPQVTEADIRIIREMRAQHPPVPHNVIARRFGISPANSCRIALGRRWSRVA